VKLLRTGKTGHVFQLNGREQQLLLETIKLYPLVPVTHHRLSQSQAIARADENQRLLEESLAEHRAANRRQVLAMLNDGAHFREGKSGFELHLSPGDLEWLLQVLNDVRVGSWLNLGEPEPPEPPEVSPDIAKYVIALELAGMFESMLLSALGVDESPEWIE